MTPEVGWPFFPTMKLIAMLVALGAAVLSLTSCGLPGALVRSGANLVNTANNMLGGG